MKKTMSILLLATAISGHAATCDELAVGESLRQDFDGKESLTGLEQRYTLYRESVDRYEVIVNPLFIADTREAEKALKDKLITCLNEKSEAFSSKSEITIKLKVYDESTDKIKINQYPPVVGIQVLPAKTRAHSRGYNSDVNCKTMIHETLHLTGLVDEYKELSNDRYLYPQRAIGPANSIMSEMGSYIILGLQTKAKLYPAHIRHIVKPNCAEDNTVYYNCAKRAYLYSAGEGKPEECRKKSFLD